MLYPEGRFYAQVDIPEKPLSLHIFSPPPKIELPPMQPLDQLHRDHPACRYLEKRGFSPRKLSRQYGVGYCQSCDSSAPRINDRIVIPIVQPAVAIGTGAEKLRLAGWQARAARSNLAKGEPKYLTATGTKKSHLLYGLPYALQTAGPVVIVEGITDAWKVGRSALAILGKTISSAQVQLVLRRLKGRPVIIWLDAEADEEAEALRSTMRRARVAAGDAAAVVIARTPSHRGDPGDCKSEEIAAVIELALESKTKTVLLAQIPYRW